MVKQVEDNKTIDLVDPVPEPVSQPVKRGRGRPKLGKPPKTTSADRMKAKRERERLAGFGTVTVTLPLEVIFSLDKYIQFKDLKKDEVIEKLVRAHLLRKR